MDMHDWPYIKKSARRKKRLVKKDFDKKIIQLSKRRQVLSDQIRNLPPVVLVKPYQRGWMRQFVLRDDIAQSDKVQFYTDLLAKINTYWWHHDKTFKRRKIRKDRYHYEANLQKLRELSPEDFDGDKLKLTDAEKRCFYFKETWCNRYHRWENKYVFAEAWRYVLVIKPHMVYTIWQVDELLERELSWIEEYINWNNLQPRAWKLMGGKNNYWKEDFEEQRRYTNELKNKPLHVLQNEYMGSNQIPTWAI